MKHKRVTEKRAAMVAALVAAFMLAGAWVSIGSVAYAESSEAEVRRRIAEILREAEQGDIGMQVVLGYAYVRGWGVPQSFAEAQRWWRIAAAQGDTEAQVRLAFLLLVDSGVIDEEDGSTNYAWYNIGRGSNMEQALIEAYAWVNVAASGDLKFREIAVVWTREELAEVREELAELMTSEAIAEAQRISLDLWERIEATD